MAETTIEWTATPGSDGTMHQGFTLNPWIGCERVDAMCDLCYADVGSRRLAAQHHLKLWDEGSSRYQTKDPWGKLVTWNRRAEKLGVRLKVFCASYSDWAEDRPELVAPRQRLFDTIVDTPWLDLLLLTKRPQNINRLVEATKHVDVLTQNVWLGTSVGTKPSLERAVQLVRSHESVHKFLSMEPLLDPTFDLDPLVCQHCWGLEWQVGDDDATPFCPECETEMVSGAILDPLNGGIDWLIIGGESGGSKEKFARPLHLAAARQVMAQAKEAGVPVFFKQMGRRIIGDSEGFEVNHWLIGDGVDPLDWKLEWVPPWMGPNAGKKPENAIGFTLFDGHGGDPADWAPEFRVREYPDAVVP